MKIARFATLNLKPCLFFHSALALLLAVGLQDAVAGPGNGGNKGQFETRFFDVTFVELSKDNDGIFVPSVDPVFWPAVETDDEVRIGRLEDGANPRILINRINCGGFADPCLNGVMNPANLNDLVDPACILVDPACFPGDANWGGNGNEDGTAGFAPDAKTFWFNITALASDGKEQYYQFIADCVPTKPLGTFLDLKLMTEPDFKVGDDVVDFKLTTWTLAKAAGPGGGKNACEACGDLRGENLTDPENNPNRKVIVTVRRIK